MNFKKQRLRVGDFAGLPPFARAVVSRAQGAGVLGDDFTAAEAVCIRSARVADAVERYVQ